MKTKNTTLPIQSRPYLFKDTETGAIISQDQSSYKNVLNARQAKKKHMNELDLLKMQLKLLQDRIENQQEILE